MRPDPDGPLPDPAGDGAPRAGTLAGLTASQYLAVVTDASPLCVVAGAGSGKTRVLTRRVARRVLDGSADAEHSVVVTFTRKAASELRRRLAHLGVDGVAVGTFHGIALAELRRHWADTGQMAPAVVDDPARILRQVAGNDASRAGSSGSRTGWPETAGRIRALASEIEWAQARGVDPAGYTAAARAAGRRAPLAPDAVADLYQRYVEAKARRHIVDLHDLVAAAAELIETDQVVADAVHWRVRHLYVDEFQDVNPAQWHLVRALLGDRRDLCAVGDPDQAIYSWNGADPTLMARLPELLPGTTVLHLDDNHRSTPQILAAAHAALRAPPGDLAGRSGDTDPHTDPHTDPQANPKADPHTDPQAGPQANPQTCPQSHPPANPQVSELRLLPAATQPDGPLPVVRSFDDEAAEAAGVVRWLRLAHHPGRPWAHLAVLARTRARLGPVAEALAVAGIPVRDLTAADRQPATPGPGSDAMDRPSQASARTTGAGRAMGTGGAMGTGAMGTGAMGTGAGTGAGIGAGTGAGAGAVSRFATPPSPAEPEIATSAAGPPHDAVELATFHRAKGLEWSAVALVGLEDGTVPIVHARSPAALAEERRLLYVAITRAERELWCSWARARRAGGTARSAAPSPWLAAIETSASTEPAVPTEVARDRLRALRGRLGTTDSGDLTS